MDKDIIEYCIKTISFINNDSNDYEKIIGHLLKEIKENDLVYINRNKKWYKYDKNKKKWDEYNFKIVLSKTTEFYEFFDDIMIKYLDNENKTLNTNNKKRFKRTSKNIALHIFEQKINMDKLYKYCCKFFSINEEV